MRLVFSRGSTIDQGLRDTGVFRASEEGLGKGVTNFLIAEEINKQPQGTGQDVEDTDDISEDFVNLQ